MKTKKLKQELIDFYRWVDENAIYQKETLYREDIDEYLKYRETQL